jgi:hypothetical protein
VNKDVALIQASHVIFFPWKVYITHRRDAMSVQMIELEEVKMIEVSDDVLEAVVVEAGAQYTETNWCN